MSTTFQKYKPQEGEVIYIEQNPEHPFALRNITELLHSLCRCEEGKFECNDGVVRSFFVLTPDTFQGLLVNPRFREDQYAIWHTTKKTILPVPLKFPKLTLEDARRKGQVIPMSALRVKTKRGRGRNV